MDEEHQGDALPNMWAKAGRKECVLRCNEKRNNRKGWVPSAGVNSALPGCVFYEPSDAM
jgi:hypothetical protein